LFAEATQVAGHGLSSRPACSNDARIQRELVESGLLAGIKKDLLAPEMIAQVRRHVQQFVQTRARSDPSEKSRLAVVEKEIVNQCHRQRRTPKLIGSREPAHSG
jgi:hypothetical protein